MYISFSVSFPVLPFFLFVFLIVLFPSPVIGPARLFSFLLPSSFLLFLVTLLFLAMIVVVAILDLSKGGFS